MRIYGTRTVQLGASRQSENKVMYGTHVQDWAHFPSAMDKPAIDHICFGHD